MGVGVADGRRWVAEYRRCHAPVLHHASLVIGGNGGLVAGQLDVICARQLAFNDFSTLYLVVYSVRLFVHAGFEKWS